MKKRERFVLNHRFNFAVFNASKFPGLCHHDTEVFVRVDRGGHVLVVVAELVECDDAIGNLGVPHAHELTVGLLGRLLTVNNVWVLADIVNACNIIESHLTVSVDIKLVICLSDESQARIAEISSQCTQELIEVNGARIVAIKVRNKHIALLFRQVNVEVLESPHELISV